MLNPNGGLKRRRHAPCVSVIIPAYNAAPFIAQTLDGILSQTIGLDELEVIVFLDACSDQTPQIVAKYAAAHPELAIRVIQSDVNCGPATARNACVAVARGQYIHFMDADDIINLDFYRALCDAAGTADVVMASFICERNADVNIICPANIVVSAPQDKVDYTRVDRHGYSVRYLVRRDFWMREKFEFPTDMRWCEDLWIMVRMIYAANRVVLCPDAVYVYKNRENSLLTTTDDNNGQRERDWRRASHDVAEFLQAHGLRSSAVVRRWRFYQLFGFIPLASCLHSNRILRWHLFGIRVLKIYERP